MSQAGKFIPGGSGNKAGSPANRTGPIRAPAPGTPPGEPSKKSTIKGSSLIKPVSKGQRVPILIMSSIVCCLLVSVAWYEFALVPANRAADSMRQQIEQLKIDQKKTQDDMAAQKAAADAKRTAERATLTLNTVPPGATVTIGDIHKPAPATFDDLTPGNVTVYVQADGYEDYKQDVAVAVDKPTDLGTITLVQKLGNLTLSSPQSDVEYTVTGPNNFSQDGKLPDKLQKLPVGDYQIAVWQHDWKLPPVTVTIHDKETVDKEIKFPYATVTVTTVPSGATLRQGHVILGKTPFTLGNLRPSDIDLSVDLPPYPIQKFSVHVPEFGNVTKAITLTPGKDFVAGCGMPMVWVPDGDFWAGKYLVRQSDFETVAGYNPSFFRRPNRPVEQISWDAATAFCEKLTKYEQSHGKLPQGYHYALPTESQWSTFSADADINQAPMSRDTTLSSTQDVGASEPNKYGIYDTLGNVWEMCSDTDERGNHSLRGGNWLSSPANFPNADTRQFAGPTFKGDRFTGFRIVLVPN